ncbi:hypothetical protein [Actinocatenispora rupis]
MSFGIPTEPAAGAGAGHPVRTSANAVVLIMPARPGRSMVA